jgi:hypothetical protein
LGSLTNPAKASFLFMGTPLGRTVSSNRQNCL